MIRLRWDNLRISSEVLDIPACVKNIRTKMVDDYEKEVVPDSDDEGTRGIEEVNFIGLCSNGTERKVGQDALRLDKRQLTSYEQDENLVASSLGSARKQSYAGYLRRRVYSVYALPPEASDFAGLSTADNESSSRSNSVPADIHSQKQLVIKNNGTSRAEDQGPVDAIAKDGIVDHDNQRRSWKLSNFKDETVDQNTGNKVFNGDTIDGKKVSSSNYEASGGGQDIPLLAFGQEPRRLSYIGSQEPGESSQANALDFVETYLSNNNVNLSKGVAPLKTSDRGSSPPVLSSKGPQDLARRSNHRLGNSKVFEWDGNQMDNAGELTVSKRTELILDYDVHRQRSISRSPICRKKDVERQDNLDIHCKEMGSSHLDSSFIVDISNDVGEKAQIYETKIEKNLVKKLEEQFHADRGQQLETGVTENDVPDTFDVGFNTQMAAEAMEALFYAAPSHFNAANAHQSPQNMLGDILEVSPNGPNKGKASKRGHSSPKSVCLHSGVAARRLKLTQKPAKKLSGCISHSFQEHRKNQKNSDVELSEAMKLKRGKLLTESLTNCRKSTKLNKRSRGRSQLSHKRTKEGPLARDGNNINSSMSGEIYLLGKGPLQGKVSPIAHRTRIGSSLESLERTEDPLISSGQRMHNVTEDVILEKGRKRGSSRADVLQVVGVSGKCPKLGCTTSVVTANRKISQQARAGLDEDAAADASCLKLDAWNYPKGKRNPRRVPGPSNRANNLWVPMTVFHEEGINGHCIESNKKSEQNSTATGSRLDVKRKAQSKICYRRRCSLGKKYENNILRRNFNETNFGNAFNCDFAFINMENIPKEPDTTKSSRQFGQLDNVDSMLSDDETKRDIKLNGISNETNKGSLIYPIPITNGLDEELLIFKGGQNHRPQYNKKLSRSPLEKELIRLGITESLPNVLPKDMRRRRGMANSCVFFSQNLDGNIIKQQKKIVARLGISIASCCSEATHFVTDRFARTRNMLEAIALGKPVVTHLWLESCGQASCFIDEKNYIMRDAKKEREIGFSMPVSLALANHHPLLKGVKVFVTPNIKPGKELILGLVKAAHGQAVGEIQRILMMDETIPDDFLILSCEQDYAMCVPFLEKGASVYSSELLLNGIVIQKLEYKRHQLFTDQVSLKSPNTR